MAGNVPAEAGLICAGGAAAPGRIAVGCVTNDDDLINSINRGMTR
jgi:hypothetical protein